MSLYYHVANKDAILDGVVEVVIDEINQAVDAVDGPSAAEDWMGAMRAGSSPPARCCSATSGCPGSSSATPR